MVLLLLDRGVDVNFVAENTASLIAAVKNGHYGYCVVSPWRNMQVSGIYHGINCRKLLSSRNHVMSRELQEDHNGQKEEGPGEYGQKEQYG